MDDTPRSPNRILIITLSILIVIGLVAVGLWLMNRSSGPVTAPQPAPSAIKTDKTEAPSDQAIVTDRQAKIVYIADGDNGNIGTKIGCDDSAVVVSRNVKSTSAAEGALQALLADKSEKYGTTGLRNALWQSNLRLDSITVDDKTADVKLSGDLQLAGVCDNPRVKAQLEDTVKESSGVTTVNVTINGKTLDEVLSLK
jgi:hypothetical protein